jgi:hypothetical protein
MCLEQDLVMRYGRSAVFGHVLWAKAQDLVMSYGS